MNVTEKSRKETKGPKTCLSWRTKIPRRRILNLKVATSRCPSQHEKSGILDRTLILSIDFLLQTLSFEFSRSSLISDGVNAHKVSY